MANGPVVDVPIVGGKVNQSVVQSQLLVVEVGEVLFCKAEKSWPTVAEFSKVSEAFCVNLI